MIRVYLFKSFRYTNMQISFNLVSFSTSVRTYHGIVRTIWKKISDNPQIGSNKIMLCPHIEGEKSYYNLIGQQGKALNQSDFSRVFRVSLKKITILFGPI